MLASDVLTRIPLQITVMNKVYNGEAVGKKLPLARFFTCKLDGIGMFALEAIADPITRKYYWMAKNNNVNDAIVESVEHEIDKYMRTAYEEQNSRHLSLTAENVI